jgi:hypothetical protein
MSQKLILVPRPRVLAIRRVKPGCFSTGDEASAQVEPGLLQLLTLQDSSGSRIGGAFAPEWLIGIGAATTAAVYASQERLGWFGISLSVEWLRPSQIDETLVTRSVIESVVPRRFGKTSLIHAYEVRGKDAGDIVAKGKLVLASGHPQASVSSDSQAPQPIQTGEPVVEEPTNQNAATLRQGSQSQKTGSLGLAHKFLPQRVVQSLQKIHWQYAYKEKWKNRPALQWVEIPALIPAGEEMPFQVEISNNGTIPPDLELCIELPFGFGLDADWSTQNRFHLAPGESACLGGLIRALRPDEVNLGKPWPLSCVLKSQGEELFRIFASVSVPDHTPAKILYVLTEDCETFDGGENTGSYGDMKVLGNYNNVMDTEEYRIQMIDKPNTLNRIAEKHGARWTHFWTATQLFAAQWAAKQSQTGAWKQLVSELKESVQQGAQRHEYAPHIHFDFEPDSALPPQPRLLFDRQTDGFLPNEYYDPIANPDHQYHGWDGARKGIAYVKEEGDLWQADSKTGSLRKSARLMMELGFRQNQVLITRTGACDFGATPEDIKISCRALVANGLLANADAGLYKHVGEHPRGRQLYFCSPTDLELEIEKLEEASMVQMRAPEVQIESTSLRELNTWFDKRLAESSGSGVRVIASMTHAMFMKGEPDPFRSLSGGDFEKLDKHLEYVKTRYPNVTFATASEAVREFLDYYSPGLRAVITKPIHQSLDGKLLIYPIHILGQRIPVSQEKPMTVSVQAPLAFDSDDVERLTVVKDGQPIASLTPSRNGLPGIEFLAQARSGYELEVRLANAWDKSYSFADRPDSSSPVQYEEILEAEEEDIFRLEQPSLLKSMVASDKRLTLGDSWEWLFPSDLFHFLVNPLAGGKEPLARRIHPFGLLPLGAALYAAAQLFEQKRPTFADIRWLQFITGKTDFRLQCKVTLIEDSKITLESLFFESETKIAQIRVTLSDDR